MATIRALDTAAYRGPLPIVLSDSTHGDITHFELITARITDADGETGAGTGDFILNIDNNNLQIHNNNVSRFFITGKTENASFNFYFGDGRIEAANFEAQFMQIYHRGSNDMIVKPIQKITGILNSTGNVILKNVPPIVEIEELYQGKVIYN